MRDSGVTKGRGGRRAHLAAAAGVAMVVLAAAAIGCGGSSTNIFPFAGVWVANSGGPNVLHFSGSEISQLSGNLNVPPKTQLNSGVFISPQDTVFDSGANLWVVDGGTNDGKGTGAAVYKFTSTQLAHLNSTPAPTPAFIVTGPVGGPAFFKFPQFAAFDTGGNLWVSDSANNEIFEFTAAQLSSSTGFAVLPSAVLVGSVAGVFNAPLGMAFDSSGNLWVENNGGTTIVEIAEATLAAASGITLVTPATILTSVVAGGFQTINNPWGILFDAKGNMWITNEQLSVSACSGNVVEFTAAAIGGGGLLTPPPNVMITPTAVSATQSLCDPNGISMNTFGNITVANAANNSLAEYTAAQLVAGGAIAPNLFINGTTTLLSAPTGLSYGPLFLQ